MKVCYILPQGRLPKVHGALIVKLTEASFHDVYDQYYGYRGLLCLLVAPQVPEAALLKFVEDAVGDLVVVVHTTPSLVFLSRFTQTIVGIKPTIRPYPDQTTAQVLLAECKQCCR